MTAKDIYIKNKDFYDKKGKEYLENHLKKVGDICYYPFCMKTHYSRILVKKLENDEFLIFKGLIENLKEFTNENHNTMISYDGEILNPKTQNLKKTLESFSFEFSQLNYFQEEAIRESERETIKQLSEIEKEELAKTTNNIDILEILLFDKNWMIVNKCFFNSLAKEFSPLLIEKVFEEYRRHIDGTILIRIAENRNTPTEILLQILKTSKSSTMRAIIATNRNCSLDMIKNFSTDEDGCVRGWVARNENISSEILHEMLEKEEIEYIIEDILSHKNYRKETK